MTLHHTIVTKKYIEFVCYPFNMSSKKKTIGLACVILLIAATSLYFFVFAKSSGAPDGHRPEVPAGYQKVSSFRYVEPGQNTCQAVTPECGYCPGKIIDKACYEPNGTIKP